MLKSLWSIRLYGPNKISYSTAFTGFSLLVPLIGKTTEELVSIATSLGEAAFRGKQLAEWIYRKGAADIELMTNLPKAFRKSLSEKYTVYSLSLDTTDSAEDGTVKYLLQLHDNEKIETVYLPYSERVSVCVSSQVGCAAG